MMSLSGWDRQVKSSGVTADHPHGVGARHPRAPDAGPVVGEAFGWGALAASSLVLGALIGLARPWPKRLVGLVLGFGAGALMSAVSFELAQEGVEIGGAGSVAVGMAFGALTFYVLDGVVERRTKGSGAGSALALGAFLDGVPEQLVLGLGLAAGDGVSVGLLAAIFVSNLPEGVGSASAMLGGGRDRGTILRMWIAVAVVCTLASGVGFGIADSTGDMLEGGVNGFAAGALLVMLVDSMIPDATSQAGRTTGLVTTLGFAVASGLSGIS
jgi:zinc transporter, ZIP family